MAEEDRATYFGGELLILYLDVIPVDTGVWCLGGSVEPAAATRAAGGRRGRLAGLVAKASSGRHGGGVATRQGSRER